MRPSQILNANRETIRRVVRDNFASNPRVFGSASREADTEASDLDLLVDPQPGLTLFKLAWLENLLAEALRVRVDVRTPKDLPESFRYTVLAEAQAV